MNIQAIKINFKNKEYKINFQEFCNDDLKFKKIIKEEDMKTEGNI